MGRLRIKKKEVTIPLRETIAYRLLLAAGSVILFLTTVFFLARYASRGYTVGIIASAVAAVMAGTAVFYNLGQVRNARVPASALKRAKRRG